MISTPGLLRGWEGVDVAASLTERIGRPVYVDSEANLGGLAEAREGSGRAASSSVFIRVGHTISAGLIVGGDLFRGVNGKAGQIGHVTIDENGPICRCSNRGCLETYAGGPALLSLFPPNAGMQRISDLLQAAEDGEGSSRRVIADAGRHIGIAAASLCNLFDPELIVVGGELAQAGEILMAPMRHSLERTALASAGGLPEIVGASFGEWAETRGAIAIALDHVTVDAEVIPVSA
jgi:predicted NBD/HSP70 family sugar kinase